MQEDLDQLTGRLVKSFGARLVSVILYGSAATGEHDREFSDLNILCVLNQITPAELRDSEPLFRWWRDCGHPPPLLLSEQEVETSTDCFAIEFHDIRRHHRILHGKDVVSGMTVDDSFYRAQVERELRAKLLRLRTKAAQSLSDREMLARLLADSISTFCVLMRHSLLLHSIEVEPRKRAVVERSRDVFGIDASPFLQLIEAREDKAAFKKLEPEPLLAAYLRELSIVIGAVDRVSK